MADVATDPGAAAPALDLATSAALEKLHDIVAPAPPSWLPQTWGWAALALLLVVMAVLMIVRARRRRAANLYRVQALAELAALERRLDRPANAPPSEAGGARADALRALPPLLKRVALAAWPRDRVARLTQDSWTEWLRANAPEPLPDAATRLLDDLEYRSPQALAALSDDDARACIAAARRWIETHRVPA